MEAVAPLAAVFVVVAVLTWRHQRRDRRRERGEQIVRNFDAGASAALEVAAREVQAAGGSTPGPAALLLGLLQAEAFAAALVRVGGVPGEAEGRSRAALARDATNGHAGAQAIARASLLARSHGRAATCTDLWVALVRTPAADLVSPASPHALAFLLVHGCEEPPATHADPEVQVVLHNDDHTTRELVVEILREVFALSDADAAARMQEAHEHGRAVVGRYDREDARARVEAARVRARAAGSPLWIGVEAA